MIIIIVIICAVSSFKNQNRELPLRKTEDCPDPGRPGGVLPATMLAAMPAGI